MKYVLVGLGLVACGVQDLQYPQKKNSATVTENSADATAFTCAQPKSYRNLIAQVTQDIYGRSPTEEELAKSDAADFSYETFVDNVLSSPQADDGITRFVSRLFRLETLVAMDDDDVSLIGDLKQELVVLVLRNKDKPWSYFFNTSDIFCSKQTAPLYDFPVFNTEGFISCKLPEGRKGILSTYSFLRATSPLENPQAFYLANNNYHRVNAAIYFATGILMQAATNGPAGEGIGTPMESCVPVSDMRVADSGLVFGSAAIPLSGSVCAGCHAKHMAPLSIAFRKFDPQGHFIQEEDIDSLNEQSRLGVSQRHLKFLLKEKHSCWNPDPQKPAVRFQGLDGLGDVIAKTADFGTALGRQIPQVLSNRPAHPEMVASIKNSFDSGSQTLQDAFRGFLLAQTYRCDGM